MRTLILILLCYCAEAQVYSSWASTQIRHQVEIEKPKINHDTVSHYLTSGQPIAVIKNVFAYKDFQIEIFKDALHGITISVSAGQTIFALKPDDEYAVLEKLLPLCK